MHELLIAVVFLGMLVLPCLIAMRHKDQEHELN